ncbi:MAG: hypothetical protein CSA35_05575 [Dethiosulfovibrio peptidovorans]|nr:MAG: hypothetical protein CSA35_05575 [Dethiosulfovibrio peptidovorans]
MSYREIKRIKVMELLVNGGMSNHEAAESLSLCRRRIISLRKKYKAHGEMALIHGNRGKHPRQRKGCTALHAYIDDATGIVVGAYLTENESTAGYVSALALGKERRLSTFGQGVKGLGTGKIFALSPEAKGRVECLWNVLQDRLPGKLRLPDVSDIEGFPVCTQRDAQVSPSIYDGSRCVQMLIP